MITTTDYDDKHVFLRNDLSELGNNPIRCNHLVIIYVREGEMKFEQNYVCHHARAHSLVLLFPFDIVMKKEFSRDFKYTALVLPMSLVSPRSVLNNFDFDFFDKLKTESVVQLYGKERDIAGGLFDTLQVIKETFEYEEFEETALLMLHTIFQIYKSHFKKWDSYSVGKNFETRKRTLFRRFIKSLIASSKNSREVLYYANELGVSSGYLNEVCNEVSSHSAKEIIDSTVVSRLKYELSFTDKSIQELSDEYNFPSQSYLSRYYKRVTGVSPSEFRKNRNKEQGVKEADTTA